MQLNFEQDNGKAISPMQEIVRNNCSVPICRGFPEVYDCLEKTAEEKCMKDYCKEPQHAHAQHALTSQVAEIHVCFVRIAASILPALRADRNKKSWERTGRTWGLLVAPCMMSLVLAATFENRGVSVSFIEQRCAHFLSTTFACLHVQQRGR